MSKQILFDDKAREKLYAGIETLARTVSVTLGPAGRNVILEKSFGAPVVTKDGVSVAKEVEVEDQFENLGVKLVREVASKTNDEAGDGTTTATVLAAEIVRLGLRYMAAGASPTALRNGIDKAVKVAVESIEGMSKKVKGREDIARVATISANHDHAIGEILAEAVERAGKQGVITLEEGDGIDTKLDYVDGMSLDKGFLSPYFVTNLAKMTAEMEDVMVLIHEKKISNLQEFLPVLELAAQTGKPLLIIAEDIEGEALAALVVNKLRGIMNVCAIKAPGFGDRRKAMLGDIAVLTGGTAIMDETGQKLSEVTLNELGSVKKVTVEKERTILVGGAGAKKAVQERVSQIEAQIERSTSAYDKEKLEERLAKMSGGVAVIKVGGSTEAALKERKHRVEDALAATRAAKEEGVVPGGGTALLRAIDAVQAISKKAKGDEKLGIELIAKALRKPCFTIAENAGFDGSVVVEDVLERKGWVGFDALAGKCVDMGKEGILDPAKVVRVALQNAGSIAGLLLTTNTLVTDVRDEKKGAIEGAIA
ncbi:MAG: chaperonin GroEL [Planctomycetota bacterium]|nr:chaperonin GroEL [Planctomycetota bacterium]MDA1114483.1 chaperonin GroEL [Planctomycetota bacterium]